MRRLLVTAVLAALAGLGAWLAVSAERTLETAADPCFRYGRFECCLRDTGSVGQRTETRSEAHAAPIEPRHSPP
jgi:hypothetical protein